MVTTFGPQWDAIQTLCQEKAAELGPYDVRDVRKGKRTENWGGNLILIYLSPGDYAAMQNSRDAIMRATCTLFISRTSGDGKIEAMTLAVDDAYALLLHLGERLEGHGIRFAKDPVLPEIEEATYAMVSAEFSLDITVAS